MVVDAEMRSAGIGAKLMGRIEKEAARFGCDITRISIRAHTQILQPKRVRPMMRSFWSATECVGRGRVPTICCAQSSDRAGLEAT